MRDFSMKINMDDTVYADFSYKPYPLFGDAFRAVRVRFGRERIELNWSADPNHICESIYYSQILRADKKAGFSYYKYHFILAKERAQLTPLSCLQQDAYFTPDIFYQKIFERLCIGRGIHINLVRRFTKY
jgi:hypothetical protein